MGADAERTDAGGPDQKPAPAQDAGTAANGDDASASVPAPDAGGSNCLPGFVSTGASCSDQDECAANSGVCGHGGLCVNDSPGYTCTRCDPGYLSSTGTFPTCIAADPCDSKPGDCICEELKLTLSRQIPEVLIVLDKSGSMVWPGCQAAGNPLGVCPNPVPPYDQPYDRWTPSVQAIKTLTEQHDSEAQFGLMVFPDADVPDFLNPKRCQPGIMLTEPAFGTADAIAAELEAQQADGTTTPIAGTLRKAREFLKTSDAADKFIVLLTDGGPNCSLEGEPATDVGEPSILRCQTDSYGQAELLTQDGVQTFVLAYQTGITPEIKTFLDELARRGGTGDSTHRAVAESTVENTMESILKGIKRCRFVLQQSVADPGYVRVTVDGMTVPYGSANGWTLTDPKVLLLQGSSCETLGDGASHDVGVSVQCAPDVAP